MLRWGNLVELPDGEWSHHPDTIGMFVVVAGELIKCGAHPAPPPSMSFMVKPAAATQARAYLDRAG